MGSKHWMFIGGKGVVKAEKEETGRLFGEDYAVSSHGVGYFSLEGAGGEGSKSVISI